MLTITTEKQVIYINTNLLKSRLKKTVIKVLKVSTFICGFMGVFWILGTARASDLNLISFNQIIFRCLQGLSLCGISYILNFIKNALQ